MLTPEQRRQIEMQEAERMRTAWGDPAIYTIRNILDDIRAKVVEEPWFGRPVTEQLNDMRRFYGLHAPMQVERMRDDTVAERSEADRDHGL